MTRTCTWWTPERDARAVQLRADGLGWRRVAKALGISEGAVRYRMDPKHRAVVYANARKAYLSKKQARPKFKAYMGEFYEGERRH